MTRISRRFLLASMAGAGAILAAGGIGAPAMAQAGVTLPNGPMRLSRRLERELRDGTRIVVDRSWIVNFARQGRGAIVRGEQISAEVDAPAKLAPIASIEKSRSTADMWPILLSSAGRITGAGVYTRDEDLDAAVRTAKTIITGRSGSDSAKAVRMRYLSQIQQANAPLLESLPADLFFPTGETSESRRPVALPDGLNGEFVLTYASEPAPGKPWLARAERRIVTRIGTDERQSSDVWDMKHR